MGKIITVFALAFALFMAYVLFIFLPVSIYTEAECLRNGYPNHYVSIGLERYCSNLEGAVTVRIKKQ